MGHPLTIDSGERLPLRFSFRPELGNTVYMLMLPVLFLALPAGYFADQGGPYPLERIWLALVLAPVGLLGAVLAVACVRTRVGWTIDETHVEMWTQGLLRRRSDRAPREDYIALMTPHAEQPGFLRNRRRYQIVLWHREHAIKQVVLYAGPSEKRFRQRLEAYQRIFALPVNPEGIDLIEMPDWAIEAFGRQAQENAKPR